MDPTALTQANWAQTSQLLITVWLFFGAVAISTTSLILGYAIVPSLVETEHIPQQALKLRPVLFLAAVAFFAIAVFFMARAVGLSSFIDTIYNRWWI